MVGCYETSILIIPGDTPWMPKLTVSPALTTRRSPERLMVIFGVVDIYIYIANVSDSVYARDDYRVYFDIQVIRYTVQITFIFIDFRVCDFAFAFKTQNAPCVRLTCHRV